MNGRSLTMQTAAALTGLMLSAMVADAAEVKDLVSRAKDAGVTRILVPGTHRGDLRLAVDIAERYDGVFAAVGIHPHEAKEFDEDEDLKLFEELSASKKVVVRRMPWLWMVSGNEHASPAARKNVLSTVTSVTARWSAATMPS